MQESSMKSQKFNIETLVKFKHIIAIFFLLILLSFSIDAKAQINCSNVVKLSDRIDFTNDDFDAIVETGTKNALRFDRDYKGRIFGTCAKYSRMVRHENFGGLVTYSIIFNNINSYIYYYERGIKTNAGGENYVCSVSQEEANTFIDSSAGDIFLIVGAIGKVWTTSQIPLTSCIFVPLK